jgi:uncharacterized membrane protein YfcA
VDLSLADHVLAALAAVGAGIVNAVAGGGTLITFPTLVALGVPTVRSNITNTVALCPGYFGGAYAQRADLAGRPRRLRVLAAVSAVGGLLGSILLVISPEDLFEGIVPFLLLLACALLAFQDRLRRLIRPTSEAESHDATPSPVVIGGVFLATVYGGYFGAGLGIIVLATLGVLLDESMTRLNALKSAIALVTNVVAAIFFVFSGDVVWSLALVMAPASLVGGAIGGRLVGRLDPKVMRAIVVAIGLAVAIKYLVD